MKKTYLHTLFVVLVFVLVIQQQHLLISVAGVKSVASVGTGIISGHALEADTNLVMGAVISVSFYDLNGGLVDSTYLDQNTGGFSKELPAGEYKVFVKEPQTLGQYYDRVFYFLDATTVRVDATKTTTIEIRVDRSSSISGIVKSSKTGENLRNLNVVIYAEGDIIFVPYGRYYGLSTPSNGNYQLTRLSPGNYVISVSGMDSEGYRYWGSASVSITAHEQKTFNISLDRPQERFKVHVVDADTGLPIEALVNLWSAQSRSLLQTMHMTDGGTTYFDVLGSRESFIVEIWPYANGIPSKEYESIFYPDALDWVGAEPVFVEKGKMNDVTVRLHKSSPSANMGGISIQAVNENGEILKNLGIELYDRKGNYLRWGSSYNGYTYTDSADLPMVRAGEYLFKASSAGYAYYGYPVDMSKSNALKVLAGMTTTEQIVMHPAGEIKVQFVDAQGNSLANTKSQVYSEALLPNQMTLATVGNLNNGTLTITGLPAGDYKLLIRDNNCSINNSSTCLTNYQRKYYPGVEEFVDAQSVNVQTGKTTELTFELQSEVCQDVDLYEPDNSPLQARPVQLHTEAQTHYLCDTFDNDWLYFDVSQTAIYAIEAKSSNNIVPALQLYGNIMNGHIIEMPLSVSEGNVNATAMLLNPGRYYIQVHAARTGPGQFAGVDTRYKLRVSYYSNIASNKNNLPLIRR